MKKIYLGVIIMLVAFFVNNIALAAEGDVSLTPASKNIGASTEFDIEVHLDTNSKKIGAFNMFLDFDPAKVTVNTAIGTADNGLDAGADTTHYNCMVNDTDIANGHYRFACIGAFSSSHDSWYANGSNVHIATIHVKTTAGFTSGTASLTIRGDDGDSNNGLELELSDDTGHALALGTITGETLTYSNSMPGISTATSITTPNNDNTPVYTFTAVDLAGNTGTATWGGSCNTHFPTTTDAIVNGDNPITATTAFSEGTYSDCTLQVNDGINDSNLLHIPEFVIDTTVPVLTEQTAVTTPTSDTTPDYTFTSNEAGTITYGGDCSSSTTSAVSGNNVITFDTLTEGLHNNCTITVQDAAGNTSSALSVTAFTIDTTAPTLSEQTAVTTPTSDTTPDYTFTSNEAGTITYGGDCSSSTTGAVNGSNTITFNTLANGTHSNCTITVTDVAGNESSVLQVSSFEVVIPTITDVAPIATPSNNTNPTYVFSAVNLNGGLGTADWGGSCDGHFSETVDGVGLGNNSVTATTAFTEGTYTDCTLTVNDGTVNTNTLSIPSFTIDTTAPTLSEQTAVTTPTSDTTPDYTFTSNEAGTITYGGDCSSSTTSAVNGSNTITFNTLANGTHSNCTITVTDAAGNTSSILNVTNFEVNAPTCTSYTYSSWGSCQPSNTRTRTVLTSIPSGCVGGISPVLSESCTYTAPAAGGVDVNNFTPKVKLKGVGKKIKLKKHKKVYIRKKKLSFKGDIDDLAGGRVEIYVDGDLKETATIGSDGKWKMKVKIKKSGKHKLRFKYFNAAGDYIGESSRYYIKIDTRKPRFIHLPSFFTKYRGDTVHFEATDSKSKKVKTKKKNKIKYYKYYFLGKKVKTKKSSFIILKDTPRGLHTLKVRAYDKAGNKTTKYVVIRVR